MTLAEEGTSVADGTSVTGKKVKDIVYRAIKIAKIQKEQMGILSHNNPHYPHDLKNSRRYYSLYTKILCSHKGSEGH